MRKFNIVIVDDSPIVCKNLSEELNAVPDFEVIKTISNPLVAVEEICRLKPDMLLLDAIMPSLDGDDILEELRGILNFNMGIIVISPISNDMTISRYSDLGVHHFVLKPINMTTLIKKMNHYKDVLFNNNEVCSKGVPIKTDAAGNNSALTSKITKILLKAGVSPKLKGFCFIRESVYYVCISGNELPSVTKIVYPRIAVEYATEPEKVERGIRTAIEKAFLDAEGGKYYYETLCHGFERNSLKPHPSNREFIFTIAEFIKNVEQVDLIG